jgi:hypothetical protein
VAPPIPTPWGDLTAEPSHARVRATLSDVRVRALVIAGCLAALAAAPAPASAALKKTVRVTLQAGTEIRNAPGSWVVGEAFNGWTVYAQGPARKGYRWAWIGGNYKGCAWISGAAVTKGGSQAADRCGPPEQFARSRFIASNGRYIGKGGNTKHPNGTDGLKAVVSSKHPGCNGRLGAYANIHPVDGPGAVNDLLGSVRDGSRQLRWRYVTRGGQWVMMRDTGIKKSADPAARHYDANLVGRTAREPGNWYYVARACVYLSGREKLPK